jgi:hypothetical protein
MTRNLKTKDYYRAEITNLIALLMVIAMFGWLFFGSFISWLDGTY